VVDSEQGVTQGDAQIASYAEESGRSVIIVMNKWDWLRSRAASRCARRSHTKAERSAARMKSTNSMTWTRANCFSIMKKWSVEAEVPQLRAIVFLSAKTGERAQSCIR